MNKHRLKTFLAGITAALVISTSILPGVVYPSPVSAAEAFDADQIIKNTIAAGAGHSIALKNDGTIWAWGDNSTGQLGQAELEASLVPVQVPGLTGVVSVAAGLDFSFALKSDGTVWAWGDNLSGQTGTGSDEEIVFTPTQITGLDNVIQISAGWQSGLALKQDGTVYTWGQASVIDDSTVSPVPQQIPELSGVRKIAAGSYYGIALKGNDVLSWGLPYTEIPDEGPVVAMIPDPEIPAVDMAAAQIMNAAAANETALDVYLVATIPGAVDISAGLTHTLLLKDDGSVMGWGLNVMGELGDTDAEEAQADFVQIPDLSGIKAISAGFYHSTFADQTGRVFTLGLNGVGQLGDGSDQETLFSFDPVPADMEYAAQVSTGMLFSLALKSNGMVYAWGSNDFGQIGNNTLGGPSEFTDENGDTVSTGYTRPTASFDTALPKVEATRLAGYEAVDTAVEISKAGWAEGADTVVLATVSTFPDALAGAPLAHQFDAPILLTDSKALNTVVKDEITRLAPETILIVGGPAVVSADIEAALKADYQVTRIAGWDAYETAAKVAEFMVETDPEIAGKAVIAYGERYEDALSISPWAAEQEIPILLTLPNAFPEATQQALEALDVTEAVIVGGPAVVSEQLAQQFTTSTRYWGMDEYDTSAAVARGLAPDAQHIYLATGITFPDALAGSALAAQSSSPILLVDKDLTHTAPVSHLFGSASAVKDLTLLGGTSVISDQAKTRLSEIFALAE